MGDAHEPYPCNVVALNNDLVITTQPTVRVSSSNRQVQSGSLTGLGYLAFVEELKIHQHVEMCEVLTGCESPNKYDIKNSDNQVIFSAEEDSHWSARLCCGIIRPLTVVIKDNLGRVILSFQRPLNCQDCCYPCCLQEMDVLSSDISIGSIKQDWSFILPRLTVRLAQGDTVLKIHGPLITCSCWCQDIVYNILTPDKEEVIGTISKHWSGLCKETFTDADNFTVAFPLDLDVRMKATLLAAVFLIDYMYYEDSKQWNLNLGVTDVICNCIGQCAGVPM